MIKIYKLEKFVEHNPFMKYINMLYLHHAAIAELCFKKDLSKRTNQEIYWIKKELFNTGVFEIKEIECTQEDSYN